MALNFKRQLEGITLVPQNTITPSILGDIRYNSSTDKVEVFNGNVDSLVTEISSATIQNKSFVNAVIGISSANNLSNTLEFEELTSTPSTNPNAGKLSLYAKNDGTFYSLNSSGVEVPVGLNAIASHTILANLTGSTAAASGNTLTSIIDTIVSNVQGSVLYRNGSQWTSLAPGTSGQLLSTGGAAANPSWINTPATGANTSLSNLTATSINQSLIPNANLTFNIGSAADRFASLFAGTAKDSSSNNQIDFTNRQLTDSTAATSVDWQNHQLRNSSGVVALDWTNGTIATTHQIELKGSVSGSIFLGAPATVTNYSLTLPSSLGSNGQILTISSGNTIWAAPAAPTGITPTQLDSLSSGTFMVQSSSTGVFSTSSASNVTVLSQTMPSGFTGTRPLFVTFAYDAVNPASINVSGGVATFTYEILSGLTVIDTPNVFSLAAGTYPPNILNFTYPAQVLTAISGGSVRLRVRMSSGSVTVSNTCMTLFQV